MSNGTSAIQEIKKKSKGGNPKTRRIPDRILSPMSFLFTINDFLITLNSFQIYKILIKNPS
jgi:hypothetical protein